MSRLQGELSAAETRVLPLEAEVAAVQGQLSDMTAERDALKVRPTHMFAKARAISGYPE